jgi:hypothetical protein
MNASELERAERESAAFSEAHHSMDDLIAGDDRLVLRTTAGSRHRGVHCLALIALFLSVGWSHPVGAQAPDQTAITGVVGVGVRGAGNVGDCCGPFRSAVERSKALWLGGSVSKNVASKVNLDGELTWAREPNYVAYMQGVLGERPVRGYRADNQIQTVTMAGLVRLRSWNSAKAAIDFVAGLGWAREKRKSHLESIVFRPGPGPLPTFVTDTEDARHLMPVIAGVDFIATGPYFGVSAQCRLQIPMGTQDSVRTDLELGRQVLRFGVAIRRGF